jgi:hypothetical protein
MSSKWIVVLGTAGAFAVAGALGAAYAGAGRPQWGGRQAAPQASAKAGTVPKGTSWAVVAADGTLVRHSKNVVSVTRPAGPNSGYRVDFSGDVRRCAWIADLGAPDTGQSPAFGVASVYAAPGDPKGVFVWVMDFAEQAVDRPFHLAVFC